VNLGEHSHNSARTITSPLPPARLAQPLGYLPAVIVLTATLLGCADFSPGRHLHEHEETLVEGAAVMEGDGKGGLAEAVKGIRIGAGERVVLLVEDSRSRPGWTDSGSGEDLVVELPALRRGVTWRIKPDGARVWMRFGSAWESRHAEGVEGTVRTDTSDGYIWSVRLDLRGRWEGFVRSEKAFDLRREFTLLPMKFEEFRKRDGGLWTR